MFLLYELMVALCMGIGIYGALAGLAHYVVVQRATCQHREAMLIAAQATAGGLQPRQGSLQFQLQPSGLAYTWQRNRLALMPHAHAQVTAMHKATVRDANNYALFLLYPG